METVNIHEAKTHMSKLLAQVSEGRTVVICRAGKPIATLVRHEGPGAPARRRLGFLRGAIRVPDDFDTMGQEALERAFGGGES